MSRDLACLAAVLLSVTTAGTTKAPSVKLWLDTSADAPCEQGAAPSGEWRIKNGEQRNVHVILDRIVERQGGPKKDRMEDTIGPQETRDLGCQATDAGAQTITLVRAIY